MANSESLTLLKQDPVTWNKWRHANPSIKPDLHGADISGTDFSGANLSGTKGLPTEVADLYKGDGG